MGVVLRLTRQGRKGQPFYRIVAADEQSPRDGRYLEMLGTYNTLTSPSAIRLDAERVKYWIGVGAVPSDTVSHIIDREIPGFLSEIEQKQVAKIRSDRAKRKSAAKKAKRAKSEKSEAKKTRKAKATNKKPMPVKKEAPVEAAPAEAATEAAE